jgi:hypothetical protein
MLLGHRGNPADASSKAGGWTCGTSCLGSAPLGVEALRGCFEGMGALLLLLSIARHVIRAWRARFFCCPELGERTFWCSVNHDSNSKQGKWFQYYGINAISKEKK